MNARAEHGRAIQLISARLDGPLSAADEGRLQTHLAECPDCRAAERDLRYQHDELSRLGQPPAPRDLWARTAAALDREMARREPFARGAVGDAAAASGRRRPSGRDGRSGVPGGSRWLALTAFSSVSLAAIVLATQVRTPSIAPPSAGPSNAVSAQPTPFAVQPQDLSLIDVGADGLSVYQTRVSQVCPQPAIDCSSASFDPSSVVRLNDHGSGGHSVTLHSGDGRVAVVADDPSGGETVAIVDLPDASPTTAVAGHGPRPAATANPGVGTSVASPSGSTAPQQAVRTPGLPRPSPSSGTSARPAGQSMPSPRASAKHGSQPRPRHSPAAAATARPSATPDAAPTRTPRPTDAPTSTASEAPEPTQMPTPHVRHHGPSPAPTQGPSSPARTAAPARHLPPRLRPASRLPPSRL